MRTRTQLSVLPFFTRFSGLTRISRWLQAVLFCLFSAAALFPVLAGGAQEASPETSGPSGSSGAAEEGAAEEQIVTVYSYDSFASEWGPGPYAVEKFKEQTGISVNLISSGDAGQVLQRAVLEKDRPQADVIIGIDNNLFPAAAEADILQPYDSPRLENIPGELLFDGTNRLLPYDYGYFAVIYDSESIADPPESLEELTENRFENDLILMDPRTSSPGLGFLYWTIAAYGEDYTEYWKRLSPSILTITEGWDSGYGLFTQGEAPMVLSYTTSPAYHVEYEDIHRYKAAVFPEGHYSQVEGAGLLKGAPHEENGKRFLDFLLSEDFQEIIPLTNWMYPVLDSAELPESYAAAPKAGKSLVLPAEEVKAMQDIWLQEWAELMSR